MVEKIKKNKPVSTAALLMIPTIIVAMTAAIPDLLVRLGFQIVLLALQLILVKNFVDSYYGEE